MSWTDDRIDRLTKLWADGLSASQIAAELGGVTRNAVIGKVHRLGLSGRAKGNSQSSAARQKRPAAKASTFAGTGKASAKPTASPSSQQQTTRHIPAPDLEVPKPLMISLLALTENTCKYPIGDPQHDNFGFCGTKSRENDPYCEYHCRLVYQPASDRRRDRSGSNQIRLAQRTVSSQQ